MTNTWLAFALTVSTVWLGIVASAWFLFALIIPAFIVWISTTWMVRGGFMLAMVMNEDERLQELKSWLDEPTTKILYERIKDARGSSD